MTQKKASISTLLCGAFLLSLAATVANAAPSVEGRCEHRAVPERSKADAKALGLNPGAMYSITVAGGNGGAQVADLAGEVQRSFDSNVNDIAAGDAPIAANSLAGGSATFTVRDAMGNVVATRTVSCRLR